MFRLWSAHGGRPSCWRRRQQRMTRLFTRTTTSTKAFLSAMRSLCAHSLLPVLCPHSRSAARISHAITDSAHVDTPMLGAVAQRTSVDPRRAIPPALNLLRPTRRGRCAALRRSAPLVGCAPALAEREHRTRSTCTPRRAARSNPLAQYCDGGFVLRQEVR